MKKFITLAFAAAMTFALAACGGSGASDSTEAGADRLAQIKERGYIEVATEPAFAPYEFTDPTKEGDEQYQGMDIEIAKKIAEEIGVELKIVPLEYSAVLASTTEGKYDLAISAIAYSPEREEAMRLSQQYYKDEDSDQFGYGLLVRAEDVDKYTSIESLKDAVVTTQSASVQESIFNKFIGKDGCQDLKLFSAMTDAYLAVAENKADAAVCERGSGGLYAEANGGLAVTDYVFDADEFMGVRIGAPIEGTESLIDVVNEVTTKLWDEGQTQEWYAYYAEYAKSLGIE